MSGKLYFLACIFVMEGIRSGGFPSLFHGWLLLLAWEAKFWQA